MSKLSKIGVIGAGTMGHSIAQAFAACSYYVHLQDINEDTLKQAKGKIAYNLKMLQELGLLDEQGAEKTLTRISFYTDLETAVQDADFVIESISEDIAVKQALFKCLDEVTPPHTILASNTSSFKITDITKSVLRKKDKVILTHWFNPPHIVPLVELCRSEHTSEDTVNKVKNLLESCGKVTIDVKKEVPGLVGNRLQAALVREAFHIYEQGIASVEDIDKVVKFGPGLRLPVGGIFQIVDLGGIDVWYVVCLSLIPKICSDTGPIESLRKKKEKGELGVKTGKGFYEYPDSSTSYAHKRDVMMLKLLQIIKNSNENNESME